MPSPPGVPSMRPVVATDVARHARVVAAMREPGFYPGAVQRVDERETHISHVFLSERFAYKLKKPLVLPFLDYGTRERRRWMCEEEVRLNLRLAPNIYLGVCAVVERGSSLAFGDADDVAAVEHVVMMRRFDERCTLDAHLERREGGDVRIDEIARVLARFHAAASASRRGDPVAGLESSLAETFRTLLEHVAPEGREDLLGLQRFSAAFLTARGRLLRERAAAGLVREGHGDLRAEHVVLEDVLQVVDCIEFDHRLREIDVAADLAFLVMDLEAQGYRHLSDDLVRGYERHGGRPGPDWLIAFHGAERALVRAKVALVRAEQLRQAGVPEDQSRQQSGELLRLARRMAWRAREPLVLVLCGLSGSGKSFLGEALAEASGLPVLRSDIVRKHLAGLDPAARGRAEHYTAGFSHRTYAELGRLTSRALAANGGAIVDGTFRRATDRAAFREGAGVSAGCPTYVLCVAPEEVLVRRVRERTRAARDASDADVTVLREQSFEPFEAAEGAEVAVLRTDRARGRLVRDIEDLLSDRLAGRLPTELELLNAGSRAYEPPCR